MTAASVWGEEKTPDATLDFQTLKNFSSLANPAGFPAFYAAPLVQLNRKVKVAVFDNSFKGFDKALGKTLPKSVQYFPGTEEGEDSGNPHGLKMAEILWAYATNQGQRTDYEPEILLFRADGYTNFEAAVQSAIDLKVDIILHSIVRAYGNNFDGKGVFNAQVDRATKAGILWINAAGNYAQTTANLAGPFKTNAYSQVVWPDGTTAVPIRCTPKYNQTCRVRLFLTWNSYSNDLEAGTDKDLDMVLGLPFKELGRSELRQTKAAKLQPGQTKFAREIITADLKVDKDKKSEVYYVTINDISKNFTAKDSLRLVGEGVGLSFDHSDANESILNPADDANVITVGASDTALSSRSIKLNKPEVVAPSTLTFGDAVEFQGSSNAAALTAAAATLMLEKNRNLNTRAAMIEALTGYAPGTAPTVVASNPQAPAQQAPVQQAPVNQAAPANRAAPTAPPAAIPVRVLGFGPASGSCFKVVSIPPQPGYINAIISRGGVFVETNQGLKIMTPVDPLAAEPRLRRMRPNDIVAVSPSGLAVLPRGQIMTMPGNWAEVFGASADVPPCAQVGQPQRGQPVAPQAQAPNQGRPVQAQVQQQGQPVQMQPVAAQVTQPNFGPVGGRINVPPPIPRGQNGQVPAAQGNYQQQTLAASNQQTQRPVPVAQQQQQQVQQQIPPPQYTVRSSQPAQDGRQVGGNGSQNGGGNIDRGPAYPQLHITVPNN